MEYSAIKNELFTRDAMDKSQNNYARWKKPDKKEQRFYDSTYKKQS